MLPRSVVARLLIALFISLFSSYCPNNVLFSGFSFIWLFIKSVNVPSVKNFVNLIKFSIIRVLIEGSTLEVIN